MRFSDIFDCFESATPGEHVNVVLMPGEKPVFSRKRPKKEDNEQERESQRLDIREASAKKKEEEELKQQSLYSSRHGNENARYSTTNCRVLKESFKRQFSNKVFPLVQEQGSGEKVTSSPPVEDIATDHSGDQPFSVVEAHVP